MRGAAAPGSLLIVQASARSDGATDGAVSQLVAQLARGHELVDLSAVPIRPFDYLRPAQQDGFDGVVEQMLGHPATLFATPVYWYAMSGRLKTLFDRFSDLLSDRDPARRGRGLAGRDMWMIAFGADPELPAGFEVPFRETAAYLGMEWRGAAYVCTAAAGKEDETLTRFAARLDGRA